MASRAGKTRQKVTLRIALPKPRNPLIVPASQRAAGSHRKPVGSLRAGERRALQRSLAPEEKEDTSGD